MPVKRNILFVALTALILALGFYGADIIGHFFPSDTAEQTFISRDRSNTNAVYLKEDHKKFRPMSLIIKTSQSVNYKENSEVRSITAAMINALSRQYEKTYIFQPAGQELDKALKFDKTGYIYVEKWQYINSDRQTRYLDCIVWANDLSIAYIRFYSDNSSQLSGTEMNAGLDRLNNYSEKFYPYESDFYYTLQQLKDEQVISQGYSNKSLQPEDYLWEGDLIDNVYLGKIGDTSRIIPLVVQKYDSYSGAARESLGSPDVPLVSYWMSQLGFCDIITSSDFPVVGASKITDLMSNQYGVWVKPSYYAKDGIIYQTTNLSGHELTVLYNVREDMIEGYYFPDCSSIAYYNGYSNEAYG